MSGSLVLWGLIEEALCTLMMTVVIAGRNSKSNRGLTDQASPLKRRTSSKHWFLCSITSYYDVIQYIYYQVFENIFSSPISLYPFNCPVRPGKSIMISPLWLKQNIIYTERRCPNPYCYFVYSQVKNLPYAVYIVVKFYRITNSIGKAFFNWTRGIKKFPGKKLLTMAPMNPS